MVIVDTSVVYKWLVSEEGESNSHADTLLEKLVKKMDTFLVPSILLYELSNVLATKSLFTKNEKKRIWTTFTKLQLPVYQPTESFIFSCIEFAEKYKVSVYDAAYAVLAGINHATLVTADKKFVDQVKLSSVQLLET